jgi:UDP-glucose 4-epimerase
MKLTGKTILVTGGAGFIGSNLVDHLVKDNHVIVLDDLSTGNLDNLTDAMRSGKLEVIRGSILQQDLLESILPRVQVVMHLAVQCLRLCFDRPHYVHDVNATGSLNVLQAALRAWQAAEGKAGQLERFVYVSSSEVYGTAQTAPMTEEHPLLPTTVYGASKLAGELYTTAYNTTYGLPTVIVRPFNTYGYREHHEGASGEVIPRFTVRILNGLAPVVFGDGLQTRDFNFVTDTVDGIVAAAQHDAFIGQAVNAGCGREVTIVDIAQKLLRLLGREDLKVEHQAPRPGDVLRHCAEISKLRQATGFDPAITIDQGLQMYIDWFKKKHVQADKLLHDSSLHNWELTHA